MLIVMHCNLSCPTSHQSFSAVFVPNLNCSRVETAISELPVKILTSLLDSTTQIFQKRGIIWQSDDVFRCFHCTDQNGGILISDLFDLMTLNMLRSLHPTEVVGITTKKKKKSHMLTC